MLSQDVPNARQSAQMGPRATLGRGQRENLGGVAWHSFCPRLSIGSTARGGYPCLHSSGRFWGRQSFSGVIVFPSFVAPAIEASGIDHIERLSAGIDQFDPFSDEHDAFAISILADSHQLSFDSEGRIVLPDVLREHAGISDHAAFVGRGATFQIWEPEAFRACQEEARKRARDGRTSLRFRDSAGER